MRIGRYELECPPIPGGISILVAGTVADCGHPVTAMAIGKDYLAGFLNREAKVLRLLHTRPHPGFLKLHETHEDDGNGFVMMDPVGQNLNDYIRARGGLMEEEAKVVFRQVASAMSHAHKNGIVLRDIKLGKMFFTDASCTGIVIGDLLCSEVLPTASGLLHDQKGSPAYVSPEVLIGKPYDGKAADMWSMGVVLYRMLTASYPFQDSEPSRLYGKIMRAGSGVSFPVEKVSPAARELARRLLNEDAGTRPTADELLEEPWLCDVPRCGSGLALRRRSSAGSAVELGLRLLREAAPEHEGGVFGVSPVPVEDSATDQVVPDFCSTGGPSHPESVARVQAVGGGGRKRAAVLMSDPVAAPLQRRSRTAPLLPPYARQSQQDPAALPVLLPLAGQPLRQSPVALGAPIAAQAVAVVAASGTFPVVTVIAGPAAPTPRHFPPYG